MRSRSFRRLFTALLLLLAAFAAPSASFVVARVAQDAANSEARSIERAQAAVVECGPVVPSQPAVPVRVFPKPVLRSLFTVRALFQRPPPAGSFFRG